MEPWSLDLQLIMLATMPQTLILMRAIIGMLMQSSLNQMLILVELPLVPSFIYHVPCHVHKYKFKHVLKIHQNHMTGVYMSMNT